MSRQAARAWIGAMAVALAAAAASGARVTAAPAGAAAEQAVSYGPFGLVHLYAPAKPPEAVVLFVSGDGGWNLGVIPMARMLQREGALVVGIDIRRLLASLERTGSCGYPAGSLEELSRTVQLRLHLREYHAPVLVGYSSGATLVYAALAQAPVETFRGAISLGFCSDLSLRKPLCPGRGLSSRPLAKRAGRDLEPFAALDVPWVVLQGDADQVCAPSATARFVEAVHSARLVRLPKVGHGFAVTPRWEPAFLDAFRRLAQGPAPAEPRPPSVAGGEDGSVAGLGLVEVPAAGPTGGLMAVLLSGDGGWAGIDKAVAGRLATDGVPVVGWNSLKYYWTPRSPEAAAHDLARILEHYQRAWGTTRVLLAGYSFGADVLPFLVSRLPAELRARVALVALLGPSTEASFEFHVTEWLGRGPRGQPTVPEIERLAPTPVLCVRGEDDPDSACAAVRGPAVRVRMLPGGHHFGGDYGRLAELLLEAVGRPPARSAVR
jgi:type IV secretory pathway VirJ component